MPVLALAADPSIDILPPLMVYEKSGTAAQMIHRFKYNKCLALGRYLAIQYAQVLARSAFCSVP